MEKEYPKKGDKKSARAKKEKRENIFLTLNSDLFNRVGCFKREHM
jgi:hypothetical protein